MLPTVRLVGFLSLILFTSSCVSYRDMIILNGGDPELDKVDYTDSTLQKMALQRFQPHQIQPYDQLLIRINAFDGSTEEFINREFSGGVSNNAVINFDPGSVYFNSYMVSDSGYIFPPLVKRMYVKGMTTEELKAGLDEAYQPYLKFVSSTVKLANPRVTVLGEVNSPGMINLYNEQNTLLDALGLAGDITDFGNRKKVKIIRQASGQAEEAYVNIMRSDFIESEYYFVQPNDIIYVEPLRAKSFDTSDSTLGIIISSISLVTVIASLFINTN